MNFTDACEDSCSEKCGQLQIEQKTILADPKYFETWRVTESGVKPNGVPQRSYCWVVRSCHQKNGGLEILRYNMHHDGEKSSAALHRLDSTQCRRASS